jgi:hypothetical protein
MNNIAQMVLPLAVQGAGVVLDWVAQHPHIDAKRAGITGISWGGYLTWLINAYEPRFKAAAPVYGCGGLFIEGHPYHIGADSDVRVYWKQHFEPAELAHRQIAPVCYLSSTNDFFGMNSHADTLLNSLAVENRRSSSPNNDHHLGASEAATGLAWFKHYLADGPALPKQPALSRDLKPTVDESEPVERVEVWYSPDDRGDDNRCWLLGAPRKISDARQAFARVYYASGVSLNSALVRFDDKPVRASKSKSNPPAAWLTGDAIGLDGPLASTQYWRTDVTVTPLKPRNVDAIDSLWTIARDAHQPGGFGLFFRGLADPRWNDGHFQSLLVELDLPHAINGAPLAGATNLMVKLIVANKPSRAILTGPADAALVPGHAGRIAVRVELTSFEKLPAGATWRDVIALSISGSIPSNRLIVHRIVKL